MEDRHCSQYFLAPQETSHRRSEALRAVFVEGEPLAIVAQRFGYKVSTLKAMARRFRAACRRGVTPPFPSGRSRTVSQAGRRRRPTWT
jgi:hypothetical protein